MKIDIHDRRELRSQGVRSLERERPTVDRADGTTMTYTPTPAFRVETTFPVGGYLQRVRSRGSAFHAIRRARVVPEATHRGFSVSKRIPVGGHVHVIVRQSDACT